jgi:HEAT repeat protein
MLSGGDRRSTGRADEAAELALHDTGLRLELVRLLESTDPLVRMRAADALEKLSRRNPALLKAFRGLFVRMAPEEKQQEVRWHLAQMLPRLGLGPEQRRLAIEALRTYIEDHSAIVQAWSLNAIAEFAQQDPAYLELLQRLLREALGSHSPAVRSRAQAVIRNLERKERRQND